MGRVMLWCPRQSRGMTVCCLLLAMACGCAKNYTPAWQQNLTEMFSKKQKDKNDGIETPSEYVAKLREWSEEAAELSPADQEKRTLELAERLGKEEDPLVRAQILRTLAHYPTASAAAMLTAGMKDRDEDVRIACCEAWGVRKGPDAVKNLTELFSSDTDVDVRLAAARALGETGDASVVPVLGTALENNDPAIQYRAVVSLRKVTGKEYGDDVNRWRDYVKGNNPPEDSIAARIKRYF